MSSNQAKDPAISQGGMQRRVNGCFSCGLLAFLMGRRICVKKKSSDGRQNSCGKRSGEGNPGANDRGAEGSVLCAALAGVHLQNNEPVGQLMCQVAKTEGAFSEVAAHLAEKEHQGEGES